MHKRESFCAVGDRKWLALPMPPSSASVVERLVVCSHRRIIPWAHLEVLCGGDEDVGKLHVAMHIVPRVHELERQRELDDDLCTAPPPPTAKALSAAKTNGNLPNAAFGSFSNVV